MSPYISTIPFIGIPGATEQSIAIGPPPSTPVTMAMTAKVGAAARPSQPAARWAAPAFGRPLPAHGSL